MTAYQSFIKIALLLPIVFTAVLATASEHHQDPRILAFLEKQASFREAVRDPSTPIRTFFERLDAVVEYINQVTVPPPQNSTVVLTKNARFGTQDYLVEFYRKIPLSLLETDPSNNIVRIRGDQVVIEMQDFPANTAETLRKELEAVFRGEKKISGATFSLNSFSFVTTSTQPPLPPETIAKLQQYKKSLEAHKLRLASKILSDASCFRNLQ